MQVWQMTVNPYSCMPIRILPLRQSSGSTKERCLAALETVDRRLWGESD